MAKKKLALVPATPGSLTAPNPDAGAVAISQFAQPADKAGKMLDPKKFKKLTLPPLVKPEQIPIGGMIAAKIVALAGSISDKPSMKEGKLIHLQNESGDEFLFPLTGTIKRAVGGFEGITKNVGKTLVIIRNPDSTTTKYGAAGDAPKKVYMFDVYLGD